LSKTAAIAAAAKPPPDHSWRVEVIPVLLLAGAVSLVATAACAVDFYVDRNVASGGFHRWTDAEIAKFAERHAVGTKAHLAMALGLYTGQARQDVIGRAAHHQRV
jgi:hypothetical protein